MLQSLSSCVCKCGFLGFFFQVMHIKFRMLKCCVVYVMYHAGHWTEPAMLCKTYSINTQPQTEKCDHIEFLFILFFFCNCFFWVFNFVCLYVFIYVAFFSVWNSMFAKEYRYFGPSDFSPRHNSLF